MLHRRGRNAQDIQYEKGSTSTDGSDSNTPKKPNRKKPIKQKSDLCWKFMEHGSCPYEDKCKFAHGSHELKTKNPVNPKYKTKECNAFSNHDACPFGIRCNFIHIKKDELCAKQATHNYRQLIYGARNHSRIFS